MYDGTLNNKNSGETSTVPDDGDALGATYPRWELTARKFGEVYVVTTTTDEATAIRRYRTHMKIGTDPVLRRKNTVDAEWEHVLGSDAAAEAEETDDVDSSVRVELESGGALVIDLDSNLYTDGDPNLVVLSFDDGITTEQLITVSRSAARELGAFLASISRAGSSDPDSTLAAPPIEQAAQVPAAISPILARAGNLMGWPLPATGRPEYDVPVDPMDALQCDSCQ